MIGLQFISFKENDGNKITINISNISHIVPYRGSGAETCIFMNYSTPKSTSKSIYVSDKYEDVVSRISKV